MKRFLPLLLIAISASFVACTGCKSEKEQQVNQPTAFEQSLDAKDTISVEQEVGVFFEHIKTKKYYDAAAMLYTRKGREGEIRPYTNEEMDKFVKVQKQLPFVSYKIDHVKFLTETENELACTIVLQKGENGMPDATTKMFFTPVFFEGKWCLILTDSKHAERPISDFSERDSLNKRYDAYKKSQVRTR